MVSIELDPFSRPTVSWFILKYLYERARENGGRIKGEEYVSEMHRQWQQFCGQMGKHCGNADSFRREVRRMKVQGLIETGREEPGKGAMPRQYYVLSAEYFDAMREEERNKGRNKNA